MMRSSTVSIAGIEVPVDPGTKERFGVFAEVVEIPLASKILFELCPADGSPTLAHVAAGNR